MFAEGFDGAIRAMTPEPSIGGISTMDNPGMWERICFVSRPSSSCSVKPPWAWSAILIGSGRRKLRRLSWLARKRVTLIRCLAVSVTTSCASARNWLSQDGHQQSICSGVKASNFFIVCCSMFLPTATSPRNSWTMPQAVRWTSQGNKIFLEIIQDVVECFCELNGSKDVAAEPQDIFVVGGILRDAGQPRSLRRIPQQFSEHTHRSEMISIENVLWSAQMISLADRSWLISKTLIGRYCDCCSVF